MKVTLPQLTVAALILMWYTLAIEAASREDFDKTPDAEIVASIVLALNSRPVV